MLCVRKKINNEFLLVFGATEIGDWSKLEVITWFLNGNACFN
jgi:hypothetical protein